jgi:cytochrome c oxidase subunit 4
LLALWLLSFALSYVHLGAAALPVALGVALSKAGLVVTIFMELRKESLTMKLSFFSGLALLAALIVLVLADVATREPPPLRPFGTSDAPATQFPAAR